jgi:hypothetical protein
VRSIDAAAVLQRHEAALLAIPGVTGVGVGEEGTQYIVVFASRDHMDVQVPDRLDGVEVRVEPEIRVDRTGDR